MGIPGIALALLLAPAAICSAAGAGASDEAAALKALWPGVSLAPRSAVLDLSQAAQASARCGRTVKAGPWRYFKGPQGQLAALDKVIGKHLPIDFGLAVDSRGKVQGLEVLAYREAYGGQVKQGRWRRQFVGRTLGPELALGKGIDAISGATLSARHLTDEVRVWLAILEVLGETKS